MENMISEVKKYEISFHGKGGEFFGILIVNWLLTVLTLGIYYPWAKAKKLKFLYASTEFNGDNFSFNGTGKEMFKGFIKTIILFAVLMVLMVAIIYLFKMPQLGVLVLYAGIFAILPLAIHGSYRYRMSRTSWRGIRFGYRGNRKEFILKFYKWVFYTIITFGIYAAWLSINIRNYVLSNIKLGDIEFKYKGSGGEYFGMNLKGYFLTLITLGIYLFWWQRDLFAYYIDNLKLHKGEKVLNLKSTATAGGFFKLSIVNLLILVFTLGLGYAWVLARSLKFVFKSIEIEGDIDLNTILQSEENFNDATGDDISDALNIDFIM